MIFERLLPLVAIIPQSPFLPAVIFPWLIPAFCRVSAGPRNSLLVPWGHGAAAGWASAGFLPALTAAHTSSRPLLCACSGVSILLGERKGHSSGINVRIQPDWTHQHCKGLGAGRALSCFCIPRDVAPALGSSTCHQLSPQPHLALSVPSFTTCSGFSSAPAQEAAPASLQVTVALPSGVLGSCWAPGPCLGPAAPGASPSLRAGSPQGTGWSVGQVAYVGHAAASPLPRSLCGCLGMFGNSFRLNPALLHHWE